MSDICELFEQKILCSKQVESKEQNIYFTYTSDNTNGSRRSKLWIDGARDGSRFWAKDPCSKQLQVGRNESNSPKKHVPHIRWIYKTKSLLHLFHHLLNKKKKLNKLFVYQSVELLCITKGCLYISRPNSPEIQNDSGNRKGLQQQQTTKISKLRRKKRFGVKFAAIFIKS